MQRPLILFCSILFLLSACKKEKLSVETEAFPFLSLEMDHTFKRPSIIGSRDFVVNDLAFKGGPQECLYYVKKEKPFSSTIIAFDLTTRAESILHEATGHSEISISPDQSKLLIVTEDKDGGLLMLYDLQSNTKAIIRKNPSHLGYGIPRWITNETISVTEEYYWDCVYLELDLNGQILKEQLRDSYYYTIPVQADKMLVVEESSADHRSLIYQARRNGERIDSTEFRFQNRDLGIDLSFKDGISYFLLGASRELYKIDWTGKSVKREERYSQNVLLNRIKMIPNSDDYLMSLVYFTQEDGVEVRKEMIIRAILNDTHVQILKTF